MIQQTYGHSNETVADIIGKWNLNDDAQDALFKLAPDVAAEVLIKFAPVQYEGRDVNGKFIMFASGVAKSLKGAGKGKGASIIEFVNQWNLNEDAQARLWKLPPHLMCEAVSSFAPLNYEGQDVNGKFIMFASGLLRGPKGSGKSTPPTGDQKGRGGGKSMFHGSGGGKMAWGSESSAAGKFANSEPSWEFQASGLQSSAPETVQDIINKWALNIDAQTALFKLAPEVAVEVLMSFAPVNCEGRDVNGKFIMFASSIAKNRKGQGKGKGASIADFINHWNLNEDSQTRLCKLPPPLMFEAISSFAPLNYEGQDVNGKFIMFASGLLRGPKGGGKGGHRFSPY